MKKKSIAKNAIFKFMLSLFNIIIPILIGPYVARKLGPNEMGVVNYAQTILGYFIIFASFGVYQYGIRELSGVKNDKEKFEKIFTSLFVITVITNIITYLLYIGYTFFEFRNDILFVPCLILSFNIVANVFYVEWANESLENYDFISIKTIIVRIIYVTLVFIFVRNYDDMTNYIYLLVFFSFFNNILSYIYIRKSIKFNFKDLKLLKHIKPMFWVVILSNVSVLYTQFDKLMLGKYVNMESVAFYTIAQTINTVINTLMLTIIFVTIPRLSNLSINEKEDEYIKLLKKISNVYFLILYPSCIGMLILSKNIIILYGGNQYIYAIPVFKVFILYSITLGYENILTNQIMYIKAKEKQLVNMIFIGGILNIIMNTFLVKLGMFTPTTAITTTLISNIVLILLENYYVVKVLRVDYKLFEFENIKYFIVSLVFIPISYVINLFFHEIIINCIFNILINSVIYFIILYFSKDATFNYILKLGLKNIKKRG